MLLQELLKTKTKGNHDQLEELMFVHEIMNKTLSLEQYKTLLATNYLVHANLEFKVHLALDENTAKQVGADQRYKLSSLIEDLKEAGISKDELDQININVPHNEYSPAAALGAMYVLEGATMGGQVIQKKLRATPAFEGLNLNYYTIYGDNLMPNWKSFVGVLNTAVPESDYQQVIDSASETFRFIATVSQLVNTTLV